MNCDSQQNGPALPDAGSEGRFPAAREALPFLLMAAAGTLVWVVVIGELARRAFQTKDYPAIPIVTRAMPLHEASRDVLVAGGAQTLPP